MSLEARKLATMASGHLCLCLTEAVCLCPTEAVDDVRIWKVVVGGAKVLLVFDDFPLLRR